LVQDRYEWLWLYAAVEPLTGDSFFLLLPHVSPECLQLFVDAFGDYTNSRKIGLVLDGSGSHRAGVLRWPDHIVRLPMPPYSPELNPAEAIFRHLRGALSNRTFENLDEMESALVKALQPFWDEPPRLHSLTGFSWWVDSAKAITKWS
jgi:transposase